MNGQSAVPHVSAVQCTKPETKSPATNPTMKAASARKGLRTMRGMISESSHAIVTEKGFEPDRIQVKTGQQVTLRFTRKVAQTCADAVDVQGDPVRHMLPLNAPVEVKVTAPKSGELAFACPMNMYRGAIVVVVQ